MIKLENMNDKLYRKHIMNHVYYHFFNAYIGGYWPVRFWL